MAHYAYISNAEFTVTERARLREVENEINIIRQDNIDSEGYQLLYSTLYPTVTEADIRKAFYEDYEEGYEFTDKEIKDIKNQLYYPKSTSETLKTLEAELAAINIIEEPEAYAAKQEEINTEKEKLENDKAEIRDQLYELEYNNTEDLIAEKETLETTIANALSRVTNVIVGCDELEQRSGDTSSIDEEIEALEESKKNIDYTQDEEVWMAEVEAIQTQIQTKLEEKNEIPKVDYDNTLYWEAYYGAKRTSYNGNIRKNFAGKGMIYDPVRDAFYAEQPYPSWTLNEETCIWQPPTPKPEGEYNWKEDTTEWVDYAYINPDNNQPFPSWVWDTTNGGWNAPVEKPDDGKRYVWDEETLNWIEFI